MRVASFCSRPLSSFFLVFITLFFVGFAISCKSKSNGAAGDMVAQSSKMKDRSVYPGPGDLSAVDGLMQSDVFTAAVDGDVAFVYKTFETKDPNEHVKQLKSISYQGVSYISFPLHGTNELKISTLKDASDFKVLPNLGEAAQRDGNSLTLTLNKPQQFVIEATLDDKKEYIIVSAEAPETDIPDVDDKSVLFLGPGVHKYGQAWDPFTNGIKTVYLAPGAVVEATVKAKNKDGVRITGRGVFAQAFVTHSEESSQEQEWDADWLGMVFIDSYNVKVDGIAVMSSPSYQLEVANCTDVVIDNVKLCGFGEHNNDGIHTYSKNVTVSNSFIASNDDRICITGLYDKESGNDDLNWDGSDELTGVPAENIVIKNVVFWGLDNNGGDIMLTWNGADYAKDILIEDVVSLTATNKAFIAARHGGSADIHDLVIKNATLLHGNLFDIEIGGRQYQGAGGGRLRNMHLENVTLQADRAAIGKQLKGISPESNIQAITFKNVTANDGPVTHIDQLNLETNEHVDNLNVLQ